ncbi:MAG: MBL fold metallo-hydrolase [Gammaproteobacteria bacterium]|nr:MBL fold metallo-hydrolase [Gammaproteobacteria bacterium]
MFSILGQAWADKKLKVQKVTANVYAIIGELGNRSPENHGNNATFGFIVTEQGIVLIDSGATLDGAKAIHKAIKSVSDKAIVKVINSGGQDHRWLGNDYFKKLGAEIIASKDAVKDQKNRLKDQFFRLASLMSDKAISSTIPVYADTVFEKQYQFTLGKTVFEIYHHGHAHTPGDSYIWLPQHSVMFSGDIVYVERLLGVNDHSNSKSWIDVFESMAKFTPKYLIPGHGSPTDLEHAKKDSYNYLLDLRAAVTDFMDNGGDMSEINKVDMSKYKYLLNYDTLSGRNAQRVYAELEWE